jgi:hypothetical protein
LQLGLDGWGPTSSITSEIHLGEANPHMCFSTIELKVIFTLTKPILGLGSIKFGEVEFGEFGTLKPIVTHPSTTTTGTMIKRGL